MANLYDAHRQWANRPADERFASMVDLLTFTEVASQILSKIYGHFEQSMFAMTSITALRYTTATTAL